MTFALVDCNSFYCSCERLFRPDLARRPVAVLTNNDGCVIARTKEVKALGIPMGAPYFQVREQLEQQNAVVFSSNYALYADVSARVMEVLADSAPRIEVYSIDEAWLDLSGISGDLLGWGQDVRDKVRRWVGIPVGVGIAPTKTLAKLANHAAKTWQATGGVVDLRERHRQEKLMRLLPVDEVWGIGRRLKTQLAAHRITTAWDLACADSKSLRRAFSVNLEKTQLELRGIRCFGLEESPEPKKQIISSRSFGQRVYTLEELSEAVSQYTGRAAEKLRQQNMFCQALTVSVRSGLFNPHETPYSRTAHAQLAVATADTRDLVRAALELLQGIYRPGVAYAKAGVMLGDFVAASNWQYAFWTPAPRPGSDALMAVYDKINTRWGRGTVRLARDAAPQAWAMKREMKSPNYTTSWRELPVVWCR